MAKWEINCDGYYPYCSNCCYEPPRDQISKFCPECGCAMTNYKEFIHGKEKDEAKEP